MNSMGFLFVTKPPEAGDEFGFTIVFRLDNMAIAGVIDDKKFCSLGQPPRISEKYIPNYPDILATAGGGGYGAG